MVTNPIFIHTCVVFVRLYLFEKRFHHIAREARRLRHLKSISKTETRDEIDLGRVEKGINGRNIVILHRAPDASGTTLATSREEAHRSGEVNEKGTHQDPSSPIFTNYNVEEDTHLSPASSRSQALHRNISFADGWKPTDPDSPSGRLPVPRLAEHHVALLENQRNPKDKGTLRIPGPKDFDRGVIPQTLDEDKSIGEPLEEEMPSPTELRGQRVGEKEGATEETSESNSEVQPVKRVITIDEPVSPRTNPSSNPFPNPKLRRPGLVRASSFGTTISAARTRATTWSSLRGSQGRELRGPMPYLSWIPTIGRNSAFIDLTQEQREELGGIEYRALKTLTFILVGLCSPGANVLKVASSLIDCQPIICSSTYLV